MNLLSVSLTIIGGAITVLGFAVCFYWYIFWNQNYNGQLLTSGPYRLVRHPFYSGFLFMAIGLAVAIPIYETRFLLVITIAVIVVFIPREEEALLGKYKREYQKYMQEVKYRLIPYIY